MPRRRRKRRVVEGGSQDNRFVVPTGMKSKIYIPNYMGLLGLGSAASTFRERILKINFKIQREVVNQVPLIQSIINVRSDQVKPFCKRIIRGKRKGFKIVPIDPKITEEDAKEDIDKLSSLFEKTGFSDDPDREDDFTDYVKMLVREMFTIDQIATEIQYNRRGNPIAFWLLDGSTIKRLDPTGKEYKEKFEGYSYAQEIEDRICNLYTFDTMVFDYHYKRVDINHRGYGYSPVEQCIDILTTLIFGHVFSRDQFLKNKVPQGFLAVMGDVGKDQIDALQDYWVNTMEGAGAQFTIPILPSGKDGVGIDFKKIQQTNREMEYPKLMHFLVSLICAVFSIDPAEMGIKSEDSQSLFGSNLDTRQGTSRDRGLSSILSFVEGICNKILMRVTKDFVFAFVGDDLEEEEKRITIAKERLEAYSTVDEEREAEGLDTFDEDWSQMVANPHLIQMRQAAMQAEQQEQAEGEFDDEDEYDDDEEDEVIDPREFDDVQKSFRRFKELSLT